MSSRDGPSSMRKEESKAGIDLLAGTEDTLSRGNLVAEFLRNQKVSMKDMSQEEFMAKYEAYVKNAESSNGNSDLKSGSNSEAGSGRKTADVNSSNGSSHHSGHHNGRDQRPYTSTDGHIKSIVLKFTTLSEGCTEAPSFTVDRRGAKIGRDKNTNDIAVPSDQRLAPEAHSTIEFYRGSFYIVDGGQVFSASVRIGIGNNGIHKKWYFEKNARFSAGNSIFESRGVTNEGHLEVIVVEGPMKGQKLSVTRRGATFGRSSDNTICVPDRELSRRHSKIEFDDKSEKYVVMDMGSTNGTYIQLVGPYGGRYKLHLNDHILVGRTGFSINRFDYGLSEEMGYRQSMEDACTIVQHLNIAPLCVPDLSPQSFFGVFDGHGGVAASHYLAQSLHVNVANALLDSSADMFAVLDDVAPSSVYEDNGAIGQLDRIVAEALRKSFAKTDDDFLTSSQNPQHGSTATTALVVGKRLYCANVGDSRTMICRNFAPVLLSQDHKPSREDESKRIRDAGGFVINNRVMGELAVSRAFGDVDFKKGIQSIIEAEGGSLSGPTNDGQGNWDQPLIISVPEIQSISIGENDQFLLLACDGLFDVFSPDEIVNFVRASMSKHGDAQRCCQHLTHDAIKKRNSRDNVSVILIILNKWY